MYTHTHSFFTLRKYPLLPPAPEKICAISSKPPTTWSFKAPTSPTPTIRRTLRRPRRPSGSDCGRCLPVVLDCILMAISTGYVFPPLRCGGGGSGDMITEDGSITGHRYRQHNAVQNLPHRICQLARLAKRLLHRLRRHRRRPVGVWLGRRQLLAQVRYDNLRGHFDYLRHAVHGVLRRRHSPGNLPNADHLPFLPRYALMPPPPSLSPHTDHPNTPQESALAASTPPAPSQPPRPPARSRRARAIAGSSSSRT